MSVTVCFAAPATSWLSEMATKKKEERQSLDMWKIKKSLMNQKSLQTCTESLGSETGSDEFSSGDEFDFFSFKTGDVEKEGEEEKDDFDDVEIEKKDLFYVNYHCSIGRRSIPRSFPPPLPSISRRDGPCFKLLPRRRDGRLVVVSVPVPSLNYLHAERRDGRLLLSFINNYSKTTIEKVEDTIKDTEEEEELVVEEEEEEVEVVDRGTIVEVKVSTQAAVKLHRSSLVINKFVAASSMSTLTSTIEGFQFNYMNDLHISRWGFTSKRRSWDELLHDMRWCSELRRPLFIYEQPHCIATS